ncbi:MAG TPA: hypothetical protein VNS34_10465 [Rhizobiaceae bacterium]|nr:hypothetical protein [Rhizobiaceae bacterium]
MKVTDEMVAAYKAGYEAYMARFLAGGVFDKDEATRWGLTAALATLPSPAGAEALKDLAAWCDEQRSKLGAVDGYNYASGEEYGLRRAQIEAERRAALSTPAPASTGEAVSWRWRIKGMTTWVYDPEPRWVEEHRHDTDIDIDPLYTSPAQPAVAIQPLDEITEDEVRSRAKAMYVNKGWRTTDRLPAHSVTGLMTELALSVLRERPASCGYPGCGCDNDAVCNAALVAPASPAPVVEGWQGGVAAIAAERQRQIDDEGLTPEHDDEHSDGELADAAGCYAHHAGLDDASRSRADGPPVLWPWADEWWKPTTRRRDLIKAGALIAAEIDRLVRLEAEEGR